MFFISDFKCLYKCSPQLLYSSYFLEGKANVDCLELDDRDKLFALFYVFLLSISRAIIYELKLCFKHLKYFSNFK